uniref:DUF6132 family protein n=1 Tax=uncultured Dysgonomonas sp. TaxID=206096 RepID=UPI002632F7B4|nr:DUF6132 family protein [uncultured Dysgonomonas sp.]
MQIIKNNWTYIAGALIGAVTGYMYWRYIGCSTGTCPITSSPLMSTLYGTLMGSLFGGIFKKKNKVDNKEKNK